MITNDTNRSVGAPDSGLIQSQGGSIRPSPTRNVGEPLAGSRKLKDERKRL